MIWAERPKVWGEVNGREIYSLEEAQYYAQRMLDDMNHFNIFDADILRDAMKHPEKYENLQVRVCGWNVRFTDLSPAAQETFVREAESAAS